MFFGDEVEKCLRKSVTGITADRKDHKIEGAGGCEKGEVVAYKLFSVPHYLSAGPIYPCPVPHPISESLITT